MADPSGTPKSSKGDKDKGDKDKGSPTGSSGSNNTDPTVLISCGSYQDVDDEQRSTRLVEEVAHKSYHGEDGDDDLDKDLLAHSLLDQRKFIELRDDGKAYWTEMPNETHFHQHGVTAIAFAIEDSNNDLYTREEPIMFRAGTNMKKRKYPDLGVWGDERLCAFGKRVLPKAVEIGDELADESPHVAIEFSWSNSLEAEIEKIKVQMTESEKEVKPVNMAFLIKAVPAKQIPKQGEVAGGSLCGFDVYRFVQGEDMGTEPVRFMTYRVGVDGDGDKEISVDADVVGNGAGVGFRIPLSAIKDHLIKRCKVVFEKEDAEEA